MATTAPSPVIPGAQVVAVDISGRELERRAITGVVPGHAFPVVWVCSEDEWETAQAEGREPEGFAWPAEDVRVVETA